jgi:hypothetical protein
MPDLSSNLQHLKGDVKKIHDYLEHLNEHSGVCNELVKESNIRETSELFNHLKQIDKLIHEVQTHVVHIKEHIDNDEELIQVSKLEEKPLDIDDLKMDASHTSIDLKDIHSHVEHLITHANMCQDIIEPQAEDELEEIKEHLIEIDDRAHELLEHINEIRGELSSKYPEFIWPVPEGFDEYLQPTNLVDCANTDIKDTALKLVDGADTVEKALLNILCFTRDYIEPGMTKESIKLVASHTLLTRAGGGISKSILACALARAVSIPARIHFWRTQKINWKEKFNLDLTFEPDEKLSLACLEFYVNEDWITASNILSQAIDISHLYEKFFEIGIKGCDSKLDLAEWKNLPIADFSDEGVFSDPDQYLKSNNYKASPLILEQRLFGGLIYTGTITISQ